MTWVLFPTRELFDSYHLAVCAEHGIPHPGKRADDNETVMIDETWTDAWVDITGVFNATSGSYILVDVPPADVATYGLTVAPNEPTFPDPIANPEQTKTTILFEGAERTVFNLAADTSQPIPPTWTDPDTGLVYQVLTATHQENP
jgi:hypothetical protein